MAAKNLWPYKPAILAYSLAMTLLLLWPPSAVAAPTELLISWLPWLLSTLLALVLGGVLWHKSRNRPGQTRDSTNPPEQANAVSLASMLESMSDALLTLDQRWRYTFANSEAERMLGKTRKELLGSTIWEVYPDLVGTELAEQLEQAMHARTTQTIEEYYYPPRDIWVDIRAYPWEGGIAIFFRDIAARHQMLEQLREHENRLEQSRDELADLLEARRALINSLPAHIALLDADGRIIDVNEQWRRFALENGYTQLTMGIGCNYLEVCTNATGDLAEEAPGVARGLRSLLDGVHQSYSMEYPCHGPDRERWFRLMANATSTPGDVLPPRNVVVMHVDITERKLAEQELSRLVREDRLTGLLTREGFIEALNRHNNEHGWPGAGIVVLMDIISMRDINEAYGFDIGDWLLKKLAWRLLDYVGDNGLVGRTSGDEFMLMINPPDGLDTEVLLNELTNTLDKPFEIEGIKLNIEPRLGYTPLGPSPRAVEDLLREGEAALFEHRETPEAPWVVYTRKLGELIHQRIELTREIRLALENNQFEMYFQPKVELTDGHIFGGEALIRWNHPEYGMQSPALFIPVAEKSQLIKPLGDWILRETCRLIRQWRDEGLQPPPVAVNISLVQLLPGNFPQKLQAILDEFQISPDMLSLEITESVFERESDWLMMQMHDLHNMGIQLSLDDFGTGYSSLLYLKKYRFDEIKIDQGFVRDIEHDKYSQEIVRTVVGLARVFDARIIAEGIETPAVRDALIALDCTIGQGYYYSRPVPAADFAALLKTRHPLPTT